MIGCHACVGHAAGFGLVPRLFNYTSRADYGCMRTKTIYFGPLFQQLDKIFITSKIAPKLISEGLKFKIFPGGGGACPRTPLEAACLRTLSAPRHPYQYYTHFYNLPPRLSNPSYAPGLVALSIIIMLVDQAISVDINFVGWPDWCGWQIKVSRQSI